MQQVNECPICHKQIELIPDPEDKTRLLGFCGHTPGGFPQRVIDVPAPVVQDPAVDFKKSKGVKADDN
jgi:hypothetical protein